MQDLKHESVLRHSEGKFTNLPKTCRDGDKIDVILAPDKKTYKLSYNGIILSYKEVNCYYTKARRHMENKSIYDYITNVSEDHDAWWYNKEIEQGHIVKFTVDRYGYLITIDRGYDREREDAFREHLYIGGRFSNYIQCFQIPPDSWEMWNSVNMRTGDEVQIHFAKDRGMCIFFENEKTNVYTPNRIFYRTFYDVAWAYEEGYKVTSKISNIELCNGFRYFNGLGETAIAAGKYLWIDSFVDREIVNKNQCGNFDKYLSEWMFEEIYDW